MTPKLGRDEDGDIPPCSVIQSYKSAKAWDIKKEERYQGKQKAIPTTKRFRKYHWRLFWYRNFRCIWWLFYKGKPMA
jgi:hypothetical protein